MQKWENKEKKWKASFLKDISDLVEGKIHMQENDIFFILSTSWWD